MYKTQMMREKQTDDNQSNGEEQNDPTVVEKDPSKTLSLRVNEEDVELVKETPKIDTELSGDGSVERTETTKTESIKMDIEKKTINQYTDFVTEYEGFSSTVSSKSDTERVVLVEVSEDGDIEWHNAMVHSANLDKKRRLRSGLVWNYKLTDIQGVKVKKSDSSDTHRSYTKRKVRVERKAVEDADGRLLVLKWREADGASKGNSGWSKFQPIAACEIRIEP